jgi:cytoskeletal protein RodZ
MAGREPDYDDWFGEPEPPPERRRRGAGAVDEDAWTIPNRPARREPFQIGNLSVTRRALVVAGILVVVLFVAVLAAAGVFSSGSPQVTPPLPTTPVTVAAPPSSTPLTTTPPATTAASPPTTTLKPGDTGSQVTALQNELTSLGYSPGKADGTYGPATEQAVKNFQAAKGLTADGVVGPKTLAALQQAAGG